MNPFQSIVGRAAPQTELMQREDFAAVRWYLDHVLPWPDHGEDGEIVIAWATTDARMPHVSVRTADQAEQAIRSALTANASMRGVYAAQARMRGSRRAENAT